MSLRRRAEPFLRFLRASALPARAVRASGRAGSIGRKFHA
jgi:hypothetical protein